MQGIAPKVSILRLVRLVCSVRLVLRQSLAILVWFFLLLVLLLLSCLGVVIGCVAPARFDRLPKRIELGLEILDLLLRGLDLLLCGL